MSRARTAVLRLIARQERRLGVPVLIRRGGHQTADVVAVVAREDSTTAAPGGGDGRLSATDRDYLIAVAAYAVDGVPVVPARGDRVVEVLGGTEVVYEVLPRANEPAWRYADPQHLRYRIHVKRVP